MDATLWLWCTFLIWFRGMTREPVFRWAKFLLGCPFPELEWLSRALIQATQAFID